MKKILLTTTICVGLAASAVCAEDSVTGPVVKMQGNLNGQMGFSSQKSSNVPSGYNAGASEKSKTNFHAKAELGAAVEGKTDAGLTYGGVVTLEGDNVRVTKNDEPGAKKFTAVKVKRSYVYASSDMGKLELGANEGADGTMKIGAESIAAATGGIDGDYSFHINDKDVLLGAVTGTTRGSFLTTPSIYGDNESRLRRSNKVTYYTPVVSGFQLGVSYAPHFNANGNSGASLRYLSDTSSMTTNEAQDIVSGGVSYTNQFDQVGVAASVTGVTGKAKKPYNVAAAADTRYNDLKSGVAGLKVTYSNFSVAGSYGSMGKSFLRKDVNGNNSNVVNRKNKSDYYTSGVAYTQGPVVASVTYFNSDNFGNTTDLVSVGADYALAPGLTPYAEVTFFTMKSSGDGTSANLKTKNRGNVVIVGTKFSF